MEVEESAVVDWAVVEKEGDSVEGGWEEAVTEVEVMGEAGLVAVGWVVAMEVVAKEGVTVEEQTIHLDT